jgi:tripartite-type tricarboxylate transporter receptor subunit TctC
MIGSEQVARAAPDGYTLLAVSLSHATNPSLYKKMPYNTVADFTPLSLLAKLPIALVVTKSLPVNSVKELIDYAKANPNKLNCGSGGNGTSQHLSCELFKSMAGIDITHVPFAQSSTAMTDLVAGRVESGFVSLTQALGFVSGGKLILHCLQSISFLLINSYFAFRLLGLLRFLTCGISLFESGGSVRLRLARCFLASFSILVTRECGI